MSRKLAEAVARIGRGNQMLDRGRHRPEPQDVERVGDEQQRPGDPQARAPSARATNIGAVISQAIAGSFAYQLRSIAPRRSASQPPANTPVVPPMSSSEAKKLPVWMRSRGSCGSGPRGSTAPGHNRTASSSRRRRPSARRSACARPAGKTCISGAVSPAGDARGRSRTKIFEDRRQAEFRRCPSPGRPPAN